jgi:hypothetical protein
LIFTVVFRVNTDNASVLPSPMCVSTYHDVLRLFPRNVFSIFLCCCYVLSDAHIQITTAVHTTDSVNRLNNDSC